MSVTLREQPGGFVLLRGGQELRLADGETLRLRGRPLAEAVAAEWREAGVRPLTALAGAAQRRVAQNPGAAADAIAAYAATDLLCYRAPAGSRLADEQTRAWDPWLAWAAASVPARFRVTEGVIPIVQDKTDLAACRRALDGLAVEALAGLGEAVRALGSFVLGLALLRGAVAPAEAARVATLEERAQRARWGEDPALDARLDAVGVAVASARHFLALAS